MTFNNRTKPQILVFEISRFSAFCGVVLLKIEGAICIPRGPAFAEATESIC
jgi:hypothetical protein